MDTVRGIEDRGDEDRDSATDAAVQDNVLAIGSDERRMHVRAYNYWVSLLNGRGLPSIEDLDPETLSDFGPHSVLLDFSKGISNPSIPFLGSALRAECGLDADIHSIDAVPSRSLLSRLTDHYLQIITNRAPIGFEAEFVSQRGNQTLYRGILMPFSAGGESIDYIYGVINWKELVDADTQARLTAELAAVHAAAPAAPSAPVWADGPSAGLDADPHAAGDPLADMDDGLGGDAPQSLADRLFVARESAAAARSADMRSRFALYRALSRAYDVALAAEKDADGFADLLADAGITVQARAPMTAVVKLVFGADYDKARLTEFAAALSYARRLDLGEGGLGALLDGEAGGLKAIVKAERDARRPAERPGRAADTVARLRAAPALAHVPLPTAEGEDFVLLLARAGQEGLDVVARLGAPESVLRRAVAQMGE